MDDVFLIDKKQVRLAFGRAAPVYDAQAVMQHEVFDQMFARLDLLKWQPARILDAGCGPGRGLSRLAGRYPRAEVIGLDIALPMLQQVKAVAPWWSRLMRRDTKPRVCADIEAMPLAGGCVDMVWSNLAIQWCNDLDRVFSEFHRCLAPEGMLTFSTFGPDTLCELRAASAADGGYTHVSRFIDMHDIGDALVRAGFADPVLDVERFTLTYDTVVDLMRDLKVIGAHNATQGRRRGLEGRSFLAALQAGYEAFRTHGRLPATYEVVYGHAWKGPVRPPKGPQPVIWHPRS